MKIYIVGSVASGKTTFSKKLSDRIKIECIHLDELVHIKDSSNKEWGNRKRKEEERNMLFEEIIKKTSWIIEDSGRKIFSDGMKEADVIIHLKPSKITRKRRVITRHIKQKIGIEYSIYTPSLKMVKFMLKAINNYENGEDDLQERLKKYGGKVLTLKNKRDIEKCILSITKAKKDTIKYKNKFILEKRDKKE